MNFLLTERINELLNSRGISVRQLERDLGFGNATVRTWDTHVPSMDKVAKVADYFGVTVDYLLGNDSEDDEVTAIRKQLREKPEMRTLLDASSKCTKEEIEALTEMIERWKESSRG